MLVLNNDELQRAISMQQLMPAVESAYLELFRGEATCMPRCNVELPTKRPGKTYAMGITAGGSSTNGYLTIRLQSDVTYLQEQNGLQTREKYCVRPGVWCGLYLLFDADNGEPLAIMNDGYLQHLRQGADGGIGAKYMAREDARVLGILGSGGMARTHAPAICLARNITRIKVYSPTRENREAFAREMATALGIDVEPVEHPRMAHEGVDILATCADAQDPIAIGEWLQPGTHIVYAAGSLDQNAASKVDVTLRLGTTPAPRGKDWQERSDTVVWAADLLTNAGHARPGRGVIPRDREIGLRDLLAGTVKGRTAPEQITHSDRGGMRGVEHNVAAGRAYELAKQQGLGREIPTEWFLQNIRD